MGPLVLTSYDLGKALLKLPSRSMNISRADGYDAEAYCSRKAIGRRRRGNKTIVRASNDILYNLNDILEIIHR